MYSSNESQTGHIGKLQGVSVQCTAKCEGRRGRGGTVPLDGRQDLDFGRPIGSEGIYTLYIQL